MILNFVLPVVMKIGEYLVAPVGRQFGYLIFYEANIKNLEKQVQKLEDKRFGVQKSVEEAETKRETIAPDVERWLKTVNELNEEAKKFLEDEVKANKGCLNGWCPNLKSRYSLSRKATKKTHSVQELRGEGDFSRVSYPNPTVAPYVGTTFAFTGGFKGFESRRLTMNGVMEALTDDSIYVIGICGMGGVGKTTMAKEVAKKAEEKKMFDKIVMVVVSQNPDLINIQGMKEVKVLALSNMYSSLPTSLQCLTKLRTLSLFRCRLIDDDISIIGALENLEILRFGGSYIKELPKEIIGRLAHLKVLDLLGCVLERIYPGVLSSLLKLEELYVGSIFDSWCRVEESKEGAKAIIDELATLSNLVALDIALINITFWPRSLVIENVKKFNIVVRTSVGGYIPDPRYSLSNKLALRVQNVSDIIEMRLNLLLKSTEILTLKSSFKGLKILGDLVDEKGFECLTNLTLEYLHDLEYLINTADGVQQSAFPVLEFMELRYLYNFKGITSLKCRLPNKAFSALKELRMDSLPELTNLWKGPTHVWLGNLMSVEVIWCHKLESIFSLSIARDLVQLQDLEISQCDVMEVIVLSEGREHEIAPIATDKIEFAKLKQLCLDDLPSFTAICKAMNAIELPQLSYLVLRDIPKLKRLWPASDSESDCDPIIQPLFSNKVKLTTIEELTISGMVNLMEIWPGELQAKLREMTVERCHGLSNILFPSNSIKGIQNLELLKVVNCRSIGVAFDLEGLVWEGILDMALPSLKKVKLSCLPKLAHVWKDNSTGIQGFQNLRSLIVIECDSLRNLFSYSLAKLLVKLQEIEVTECGMMESIIGNEPNADDAVITNIIMFPQLSSLKLSDLPNLRSFCSQTCAFDGSLLKTIKVINCPKMKVLPSAFQRKLEQQKADLSTSSQHHLLDGKVR
ncbi:hypothetical protein TEA_013414 [Camellia sinensis var. sinensis]|uniref:Uncharacterized protein n=1 Tax=Camellia sinensis var. sinensis TaxID=542762 RepID=A0A4S4DB83_CAMSN|nr:hypothetical protein TEA_013414 [Camellia sinensis var. sinensis]